MVIDTSALLAIFFNEEKGSKIAKILETSSQDLRMSTVNLAETLILMQDRQPHLFQGLKVLLMGSNIRFVPPDANQAVIAADARIRFPLNLGDCFAYALCKAEDAPLLTLDRDFEKVDIRMVDLG